MIDLFSDDPTIKFLVMYSILITGTFIGRCFCNRSWTESVQLGVAHAGLLVLVRWLIEPTPTPY